MKRTSSEAKKKSFLRLHIARRTVSYIVRVLMVLIALILVSLLVFLEAERISNLYILASEGMSLRASCVLDEGEREDLKKYFLDSYLIGDSRLNSDTYGIFNISSYIYELSVKKIAVYPWSSTATVTATEDVSVKGVIQTDYIDAGKTASDYTVPEWPTGCYEIHFVNEDNRWYISDIVPVEMQQEYTVLNTPDLSQQVLPMATATPSPEFVILG